MPKIIDPNRILAFMDWSVWFTANALAWFPEIPNGNLDMITMDMIDYMVEFYWMPKFQKGNLQERLKFNITNPQHVSIIDQYFQEVWMPVQWWFEEYNKKYWESLSLKKSNGDDLNKVDKQTVGELVGKDWESWKTDELRNKKPKSYRWVGKKRGRPFKRPIELD